MKEQPVTLKAAAAILGIEVITPFSLLIEGRFVTFSAMIPQFGGKRGIVTDTDWNLLGPYARHLLAEGFGYSCVRLEPTYVSEFVEILTDWSWCGPPEARPAWLPKDAPDDAGT